MHNDNSSLHSNDNAVLTDEQMEQTFIEGTDIGVVVRMSILDTNVDGSIPSINMFSP